MGKRTGKRSYESSQPEGLRRVKESDIGMTAKMRAELKALEAKTDDEIDLSDIPEVLDWSRAVVGKFYRPVKKSISLRIDSDVLAWFQSLDGKYQTRINEVLRAYMMSHIRSRK